MTKAVLVINLALLLAVLCSSWLCLRLPANQPLAGSKVDNKIDSFMTQAAYIQIDNHGKMQSQVSAATIEHYPAQNTWILQRPDITIYNQPGSQSLPWHISAERGVTKLGVKNIYLQNHVTARQYQPSSRRAIMTLLTNALDIKLAQKIIETKQKVTLLQAGSVLKSTGLKIDMQRGIIQFLSQPSAHFDALRAPLLK